MSAARCIKLALLLSLVPLALRATSLLHGGHGAPATPSSRHSWSWAAWHGRSSRTTAANAATIAVSAEQVRGRPYRRARPRSAAASDGGTRRLRQAADAGGDWFEDDKRLAPTGSNPLHNLRR